MQKDKKILQFDASAVRYRTVADESAERGDYMQALGLSFAALEKGFSLDVIMDIADNYADMGFYELSNKYWYVYLDRAPKNRLSVAYEELAINYYYIGNMWAAGYYFNSKFSADGHFISRDGIGKEIFDYFIGKKNRYESYKIVYPEGGKNYDYTSEIDSIRVALMTGNEDLAEEIFNRIPEKSEQYVEAADEYAVSSFLAGNTDKAIEISRSLTAIENGKLSGYCNLASMYRHKGDLDKSEYYMQKALERPVTDIEEYYKLAICALESGRHDKAAEYLKEIVSERSYELNMRFFYGLALLNTGKFKEGYEELSALYRINPYDAAYKHYAAAARSLLSGNDYYRSAMPFRYEIDVPDDVAEKYTRIIDRLSGNADKGGFRISRRDAEESIEWGLYKGDAAMAKQCAVILSDPGLHWATVFIKNKLIDVKIGDSVKKMLIYVLILKGYRGKAGVLSGSIYTSRQIKRLNFEKDGSGDRFTVAYALAASKLLFTDINNIGKLAKGADAVYEKLKDCDDVALDDREALAALIAMQSGLDSPSEAVKFFKVNDKKLKTLINLYEGNA